MGGLVILHLYPRLMNLYGDRGNVLCLVERCRRRGIASEVRAVEVGQRLDLTDVDILFMGGGQDKEQQLAAQDMEGEKGGLLRAAVEDGLAVLAICGGYQLLGHYYRPASRPEMKGVSVLDVTTLHKGSQTSRCIGNVVAQWEGKTLVGFENHGGLTYLGPEAKPLARVVIGYGNNGQDKGEGAQYLNAFGTYLHGSFLPKNPHFADHLLRLALERRYGHASLEPLDDDLEMTAHGAAVARARGDRRWTNRALSWLKG
ncbi:MAG: glutamine amidotransferase [Chloroflexi bacterium]|nr:glutamine amidotransferase [Chloroflexota bacterium]